MNEKLTKLLENIKDKKYQNSRFNPVSGITPNIATAGYLF